MDNNTSDFKENSSINTIIENQDNLPINEISNQDINTKMTMQENKGKFFFYIILKKYYYMNVNILL